MAKKESPKFLYTKSKVHGIRRIPIVSETEFFYVLKCEVYVDKQKMSIGQGCAMTQYYLPTPEMNAAFQKQEETVGIEFYYRRMTSFLKYYKAAYSLELKADMLKAFENILKENYPDLHAAYEKWKDKANRGVEMRKV